VKNSAFYMRRDFSSLSIDLQEYINQRFSLYSVAGEDAYEKLLIDEATNLSDTDLRQLLRDKDISHIVPQSHSPELASDIDNVFLEDSSLNRARGAEVVTDKEISAALEDQKLDVESIADNTGSDESLFPWADEVLASSILFSAGISAVEVKNQMKYGELNSKNALPYFLKITAKRSMKSAAIGLGLSSSSLVIGGATLCYLVFKNRKRIIWAFQKMSDTVTNTGNNQQEIKKLVRSRY
jgi:hypothetical protein